MPNRRLAVVPALLVASALALLPVQPVASTHTRGGDLLPDLETRVPQDLEIVSVRQGNRVERRLRFDNEVANVHTGPLELYPRSADCDGDGDVRNDRLAVQRIYQDADGNGYFDRGGDTAAVEVHDPTSSCMVFHPQHRHWHFEDFASYELKPIGADGSLGAAVASSTKVSFCIIDIHHRKPELSGSPTSKHYTACDRNSTLGISVGWSDEYHSTLADQYVTITGVRDGTYCLVSTADPRGKLLEVTKANNAAGARITISGNTVSPRYPAAADRCGPKSRGGSTDDLPACRFVGGGLLCTGDAYDKQRDVTAGYLLT